MAKRGVTDFDPNKSDSEDETYGAPSKKRKTISAASTPRKPRPKKSRGGYGRGDDDIEDDDEDLESDEDSLSDSFESPTIINPTTGRSVRSSRNKPTNYRESDSDEEVFVEETTRKRGRAVENNPGEEEEDDEPETKQRRRNPQRMIVKLSLNKGGNTRAEPPPRRTSRRSSQTAAGTRRSSRLSEEPQQETLVALTDSGRHAQVVREGSENPEPPSAAVEAVPTSRAGKRLPETSTIFEASQETSSRSRIADPVEADVPESPEMVPPPKTDEIQFEQMEVEEPSVPESPHGGDADDDDDDEGPVRPRGRASIGGKLVPTGAPLKSLRQKRKRAEGDESSDFEPGSGDEEQEGDGGHSSSGNSRQPSPQKESQQSETSDGRRRSRRIAQSKKNSSESEPELDPDELAEEAAQLRPNRKRKKERHVSGGIVYDAHPRLRDRGAKPDYRILRPEVLAAMDEEADAPPTSTPFRNRRAGGPHRSLFSTAGPFGGLGGPGALFGAAAAGAAGGVDSDSSDDELAPKTPRPVGGAVGMTPTAAGQRALFPGGIPNEPAQGTSGAPADFGRVKDKKALADADPLGVDQNVNFDGVGGLNDHINQLKEMVALPLLYPEVFQRFHVTPPRGVLFHGPPGTGKTLLARALASSVSSQGRKVTFYMRKGADALSKWVGEAERQLRLLFEEARKNQPSIIFFDEIDGLAPVRSSKQEQIHASIVATLLALMDGMDGRGQVIVIGATNRPDSVDPALRRPGRFDREFYFPLPNEMARRSILDIHTKDWDPPLKSDFKDQLAKLTKGYGGADLRALCTEAALNAVQGTYPQIYQSNEKLLIDPAQIKVLAKDFMISVNKMVPSSERSAPSGGAPLESSIEPLLRDALRQISGILDDILPDTKRLSALEEAEYGDRDDERGFDREMVQQKFDRARVFRPRLLVYGMQGMGQQYIGGAILNKFERFHVQSFDLSVLYQDATRSPEAAVVQLFNEARRHKPSVLYIPNVETWYTAVGVSVLKTFLGLLRSLPPNEPVLLLGIMELEPGHDQPDQQMMTDLFGFSRKSRFQLQRPEKPQRREYFSNVINLISSAPTEFPPVGARPKRQLPTLPVAPTAEAEKKPPTKDELKQQRKTDRHTLNLLKIRLNPIMDYLKNNAYRRFRNPIVDEAHIQYLFEEQDPQVLNTDVPEEQRQQQYRPYELAEDKKGVPGLRETATGRFYYNLDLVTIEKRLSNGWYKRPSDFLADIKRLAKDSKTFGDSERTVKANAMVSNVEVDMHGIEMENPAFMRECEAVYNRDVERAEESKKKAETAREAGQDVPQLRPNIPAGVSLTTTESSGPVILGEVVPGRAPLPHTAVNNLAAGALSNGTSDAGGHVLTNGSSDPLHGSGPREGREDEDVIMSNGDDPVQGDSPGQDRSGQTGAQLARSMKSAITTMAENSQLRDYHNSASTTTSDQRHSSSGQHNTQSSNGLVRGDHPDFSMMRPPSGGSQLPDTQEPSSQSQPSSEPSQASQPPTTKPLQPSTSLPMTANEPQEEGAMPKATTLHIIDEYISGLAEKLVEKSSGCTVEQLEQLNAAIMDAVWRKRAEWNRNFLILEVERVFNAAIADIEDMQGILPNTQESNGARST